MRPQPRRCRAKRTLEVRGAETAKESRRECTFGEPTVRATVVIRQDRAAVSELRDARHDHVERFVPAGLPPLAAALGARANHRVQQAIVAVEVIGDLANLAADEPVGERAAAIAIDLDDTPVIDGDCQTA